MKTIKILSLVMLVMTSVLFSGCDASYVDHPIAGKAFWDYGGSSYGSVTKYVEFYSNGRFDYDYMTKQSLVMTMKGMINISNGRWMETRSRFIKTIVPIGKHQPAVH